MKKPSPNEAHLKWRLGRQIARFREKEGMTQRELADEVGLLEQTVQQIEKGKREVKVREEGRFAKALGISRAELTEGLGWTGEPIVVTGGGKAGLGDPDSKSKKKRHAAS